MEIWKYNIIQKLAKYNNGDENNTESLTNKNLKAEIIFFLMLY